MSAEREAWKSEQRGEKEKVAHGSSEGWNSEGKDSAREYGGEVQNEVTATNRPRHINHSAKSGWFGSG